MVKLDNRARCLVCHSGRVEAWAEAQDLEYLTSDDVFLFYQCIDCNALFIDPVPRGRLKEIYPANYYSFGMPKRSFANNIKRRLDKRIFRRILRAIPGERLNVLDVGGGAGWQLNDVKEIDERIGHTQVVDMDPDAAELAKTNGHAYYCGPIQQFESEIGFDLVLLLNLVEHVDDPLAVLEHLRGMLSPRGVVFVKTPNHDSLDAYLFRHANWGGYHCPRHWVLFDRSSFTKLVQKAGFQVQKFSYTQGAPFWSTSILCWLKKRGVVTITKERPAMFHPFFPLLSALFAAFDLIRIAFAAKTSQMFFLLTPHKADSIASGEFKKVDPIELTG